MIVIRANTPDPALEQTILSLLQQAQIDAEQITFCAKKKLELPGLVIDNTRHEISANGRNISLTRLESDLLWVLAVCEGTTLSKKELFDAVWGKDCADTLKVVGNTVSNLRKKLAFCGLDGWTVKARCSPLRLNAGRYWTAASAIFSICVAVCSGPTVSL